MNESEIRKDFATQWVAQRRDILKMMRGICRSPDETEELMQRVFEEIFSGQRAWVPGTHLVNYIRFVVKSIRSNERRSWAARNIKPESDDDDAPTSKPDPEKRAMGKETWQEIHDELPEFPRLVFAQSLEGNITPAEVAKALNVPEPRVYKAREKIKEVTEKVLLRHGITPPWLKASEDET